MSVRQLLFDDLAEISAPAHILIDPSNDNVEAPKDPRFQIMKRMEIFVGRAAQVPLCSKHIARMQIANCNPVISRHLPSHLHESGANAAHAMSPDRRLGQHSARRACPPFTTHAQLLTNQQAEELDTELQRYTEEEPIHDPNSGEDLWSFPLSSWAYYHKLHQMEWIVQLGFELDIYQTDELAGTYWSVSTPSPLPINPALTSSDTRYLAHLSRTRLQHLSRIRTFTTRRLARLPHPSPAFTRSLSFLDYASLESSATHSFAHALAHVSLATPPPPHFLPTSPHH